jgi:hypothetical protein
MSDKSIRDEVAELAEAVRELKDREVADTLRDLRAEVEKLRADRAAHHCHGCTCMHIHWQPYTWTVPGTVTYPNYVVTSGTSTAGSTTNLGLTN